MRPLVLLALLSIGGGWLALLCAYANTRLAMVASGIVLGGAIGAMHFTGMAALRITVCAPASQHRHHRIDTPVLQAADDYCI